MLTSGDVAEIDLGTPVGSEAGMARPGVVITAQRILDAGPRVIHIVPLTRTIRGHSSEVLIEADESNALDADSAAQCQHVRAVSIARIERVAGNAGPVALSQIRSIVAMLLDL